MFDPNRIPDLIAHIAKHEEPKDYRLVGCAAEDLSALRTLVTRVTKRKLSEGELEYLADCAQIYDYPVAE